MGKGYEAHVTFHRSQADNILRLMNSEMPELIRAQWKFSKIDGDPVLGDKVYCYLTSHDFDHGIMSDKVNWIIEFFRMEDIKPLRAKIEKIVYDEVFA